jgi:hypothetical protein
MGDKDHSADVSSNVHQQEFRSQQSEYYKELMKRIEDEEGSVGKHLEVRRARSFVSCLLMQGNADSTQPMFAGLAATVRGDTIVVGMSRNDATYSLDFTIREIDGGSKSKEERSGLVANWIIEAMKRYQNNQLWCV